MEAIIITTEAIILELVAMEAIIIIVEVLWEPMSASAFLQEVPQETWEVVVAVVLDAGDEI